MAIEDSRFIAHWTYQYLRLSMLAVILGLTIAIGVEWFASSGCWQRSISAYYYTPVQAVFVGAVVAIGVAMVVLWGRNSVEDAFLNLAGLFAPVVAFVPTSDANFCSVVNPEGDRIDEDLPPQTDKTAVPVIDATRAAIDNNIIALFVLIALGFLCMLLVSRKMKLPTRSAVDVVFEPSPDGGVPTVQYVERVERDLRPYRASMAVAAVAWALGVLTYVFMRDEFYQRAHFYSASAMFVCIIIVVLANSYMSQRKSQRVDSPGDVWAWLVRVWRDRYGLLGITMIGSVVVIAAIRILTGWEHWVLVLEATLIGLFGVFWVIQTFENHKRFVEEMAPTPTRD